MKKLLEEKFNISILDSYNNDLYFCFITNDFVFFIPTELGSNFLKYEMKIVSIKNNIEYSFDSITKNNEIQLILNYGKII